MATEETNSRAEVEHRDSRQEQHREIGQEQDLTYGLPPILSAEEAAAFLRLSVKTVYAAISSGEMPGRKVRKRTVILRDALLEWLRTGQGRVSRSRRLR